MLDSTQSAVLTLPTIRDNLAKGVYDEVWTSQGTRNRKRAAINKGEKIFRFEGGYVDPCEMPTSREEVEFFCDTVLSGRKYHPKSGLKSARQVAAWRDEYCSVCDVASGRRAFEIELRTRQDDWSLMINVLVGTSPGSELAGAHKLIPIRSLARECRRRNISVSMLTSGAFNGFVRDLPVRDQKNLLTAVTFLADLRARNLVSADVLPPIDPDAVEIDRQEVARRITPPMHPDFRAIFDAYLKVKEEGEVVCSFGTEARTIETDGIGEDRAENIGDSLRWLWHGLVVLNRADASRPFDPGILSRPALVQDLVEACASGAMGPVSATQTRRDRINAVLGFLEWHSPGFRSQIPDDFSRGRTIARTEETEFHRFKRSACLNFIRDEEQQKRFFCMPMFFFEKARPMIAAFPSLAHPENGQLSMLQNRALELAIMAALTAIMTRFPARLKTVQKLKSCGVLPHLIFPEAQEFRNTLVLDIPGYIVKNGRFAAGVTIGPTTTISPREILRWYIDDVQPLVVRYKHKHKRLRQPDLLFGGLSVGTLRRYWRHYVLEAEMALTAHMCRHFLASLLLANGVSIEEVAALLGISPGVAAKNYAFIERSTIIQGVMRAQDAIFARLEV